jgi:predicted DNA-binding transcriptional regulator YafY
MPKNKSAAARYKAIDECLRSRSHPYPTIHQIVEYCVENYDLEVSASTIEKDFFSMRYDSRLGFEAPIAYNKANKGYYYSDPSYSISKLPLQQEEFNALEFAGEVIQQLQAGKISKTFTSALEKIRDAAHIRKNIGKSTIRKVIQLEKVAEAAGYEYIEEILEYILTQEVIEINYRSFEKDVLENRTLHPYLLKEYRNRWYVIGYDEYAKGIRTFGLDRIVGLTRSEVNYRKNSDFDPEAFFSNSFGITTNSFKTERIVLLFHPLAGRYIKTQWLHETQQILSDSVRGLKISIEVIPCVELEMTIKGYGSHVQVLEPFWLRDKIVKELNDCVSQYKA